MNRAHIITGLIVIAGVINFLPVVGVISATRLEGLYGVDIADPTLEILLRHRAVLFGVIGGFMIFAAFNPTLHLAAIVGGLIAMLSFLWLYYLAGEPPQSLLSIVYADVVGVFMLSLALILMTIAGGEGRKPDIVE